MQVGLDPNSWTQWALTKTDQRLAKGDLLNVWVFSRAMGAPLTAVAALIDAVRELVFTAEAVYELNGADTKTHLWKVAVHVVGVAVAIFVGLGSPTELLRTMAKMGCYHDPDASARFTFKRMIGAALIGLAIVGTAAYAVHHFVLPEIQKAGLSAAPEYWTRSSEYEYMRKTLERAYWLDPADFARLSKMPPGDRFMVLWETHPLHSFLKPVGVLAGLCVAVMAFISLTEKFKAKKEDPVALFLKQATSPDRQFEVTYFEELAKIRLRCGKTDKTWVLWFLNTDARMPFEFRLDGIRAQSPLDHAELRDVVTEIYKLSDIGPRGALRTHVESGWAATWPMPFDQIDKELGGGTRPSQPDSID